MSEIIRCVTIKIVSLDYWIVSRIAEMIESPRFPRTDQRLHEHIAISVYEIYPLGRFADAKIDLMQMIADLESGASLMVGNVYSSHFMPPFIGSQ